MSARKEFYNLTRRFNSTTQEIDDLEKRIKTKQKELEELGLKIKGTIDQVVINPTTQTTVTTTKSTDTVVPKQKKQRTMKKKKSRPPFDLQQWLKNNNVTGFRPVELRKNTGRHSGTISYHLNKGLKEGWLKTNGNGSYQVTSAKATTVHPETIMRKDWDGFKPAHLNPTTNIR